MNDHRDAISDTDIRSLSTEAAAAGDLEQVAICNRALEGDKAAWHECSRVINAARAQETPMDAGKIDNNWLADARSNETADDRVEDWLARAGNFRSVEIDSDGGVAANDEWLDQATIDRLCRTVDKGV